MIAINGQRWRILFVPPSHPPLDSHAYGCCDSVIKTIYISNALSFPMIKKVLCHEIVHATVSSYGIQMKYEEEELVADVIATHGQEIIALTNSAYKKIRSFR